MLLPLLIILFSMPLDPGLRTGTGVEFCLVLIEVWVWEAGKGVTESLGSGEGRMPSASPGDQDHTGHSRRVGVVLLVVSGRVSVPPLAPIQGSQESKEPVGLRPLLFILPWAMPSSNTFIY